MRILSWTYLLSAFFAFAIILCLADRTTSEIKTKYPYYKSRRLRFSEKLSAVIRLSLIILLPFLNTIVALFLCCRYDDVYEEIARRVEEEIKNDIVN